MNEGLIHMRHLLIAVLLALSAGWQLMSAQNANGQTKAAPTAASGRPKLTPAQWREDLQFAVDTFLARDRSFSPADREQFRATIAKLPQTVESKTDEQIIVALAEAVALANNAHTRLYLVRNRTELRRYPIRVWWFA